MPCERTGLWYVLLYQSILVFDGSFLPRGIRTSNIYIRIKCLAYHLMTDEFRPIIGCYGFDVCLVRHKPPDYRFCQSLGILPLVEFSHEQHVGRSMIVTIAQCPSFPMMVSILKSPNRLPSISMGCSAMPVLSGICIRFPTMVRFLCFRRWRQC